MIVTYILAVLLHIRRLTAFLIGRIRLIHSSRCYTIPS